MKKLILSAGFIMVILSCLLSCKEGKKNSSQNSAQVNKPNTSTKMAEVTLDDVDSAIAEAMIDTFNHHAADIKPVKSNFFIKMAALKKIVALLIAEHKADSVSGKYRTNGMRIYFASDLKNPSLVSILLVATKDSVLGPLYHDYFKHDTSGLYKLNLKGQLGLSATVATGASLYMPCPLCVDDTTGCDYEHHPHYIRRALASRMVRAYTKRPPAGTQQTTAEWFDLGMLKAIVKDSTCDGIRIYFARHIKKDKITPKYKSMACFILTTTRKKPTNPDVYTDYFDCITFKDYFLEYENRNPNWFRHPFYPGQDNGELCPDNCN
jgi:hypothetical protein